MQQSGLILGSKDFQKPLFTRISFIITALGVTNQVSLQLIEHQ